MKLARLIKMCLTEAYSRVRVGKNLSDLFPIRNSLKQGDALSPLLFNFALEYVIRRVQVNRNVLKLNGTHQLLVYADDVNILGESVHTIKENAEGLVVARQEIGLEVLRKLSKWSYLEIRMQDEVTMYKLIIDFFIVIYLTANELTPGGSSTATFTHKQYTEYKEQNIHSNTKKCEV